MLSRLKNRKTFFLIYYTEKRKELENNWRNEIEYPIMFSYDIYFINQNFWKYL